MSISTRNIALVATSTASIIALFYRCLYLAGLAEGIRKSRDVDIRLIKLETSIAYRKRINQVLNICVDSGMDGDSLKAITEITSGPLS
jgi:hypothetical protein